MNTIILSALSGIILMFSGFYIKNNRALNILSVVLFFGMIVGGIFDLKGCSMFAGKFDNMIGQSLYGVSVPVLAAAALLANSRSSAFTSSSLNSCERPRLSCGGRMNGP